MITQDKHQKASPSFEEAFFFAPGTYIHPTAIVGEQVALGANVKVGPYCIITGRVTVDENTRFFSHVVIGFPAQVLGMKEQYGTIAIGKNCEFREFVSVHAARNPDGNTIIGNNCYLMNYSHVSHDTILEDNVTLINNVNLGGHTHVERNAILMANAATHQFCRIGRYAAVAPFSATRQDLPPFCLFTGAPAAFAGLNTIGLKRAGLTNTNLNALKHVSKLFYQDKLPLETIKSQTTCEPTWGTDPHVKHFLQFLIDSKRGVSRRTLVDQNQKSDIEL